MWQMRTTWKIRVAGAIVLASLLKASDGNALWAGTIPNLLFAGAIITTLVMMFSRRREAPPVT